MIIFLAKWWREISIALLALTCFASIRSCSHEQAEVTRIKTEDRVLADEQLAKNAAQAAADKKADADVRSAMQLQIDKLNADKRIASIPVCVRHPEARSSPVSSSSHDTTGTAGKDPTDIPRPTDGDIETDVGPKIDALTREIDKDAVYQNGLVDRVNASDCFKH